ACPMGREPSLVPDGAAAETESRDAQSCAAEGSKLHRILPLLVPRGRRVLLPLQLSGRRAFGGGPVVRLEQPARLFLKLRQDGRFQVRCCKICAGKIGNPCQTGCVRAPAEQDAAV